MAKLQLFEVVFDGDVSIFKSGDYVRGFVRIVLGAPKNDVRGIKIKIQGKARTSWSEGSGDHRRHYSARETYFKEKVMCFGKDKNDVGASKLCMEVGEHHFPFTFQIPNIPLPFPFEGGSTGWIRYKLLCKIDRPWKFNHTTERLFTVIGQPIDLNLIQIARYPQHGEDSKTVCCMCCASGPILTKASTDKGAYVPGETIFVSGVVENNSSRNIVDLNVKLIQRVVFFSSGGHTRKRNNTIVKIKRPGCGPEATARMDWSPLVVPAIPPTGPQGCNIIKIEYFVEFEGDVADTPFDATVNLPVIIGTVPLYQPLYPQATGVVMQQPSADEPPPPSYELAIEGLQEIPSKSGYDYTFGKLMYAPQYPTYSLPTHQPTWDPMCPPQQGDPAYPGGSPGYPPPDGSGYPPPPGGSGYPHFLVDLGTPHLLMGLGTPTSWWV